MAENNFKLFGFEIRRAKDSEKTQPTPVTPTDESGAINIQSGAHYGLYVDLDGSYRSEVDLLSKYRTMSSQPELESAIEDIVNEAIIKDEQGQVVTLVLDGLKQDDKIKTAIRDEFDNVLRLLDFNNFGGDIFRRWYVDGRMYFNVVIDNDNPRDGIQSLIAIDPRRIRKIRNIVKKKNEEGIEVVDHVDEFYVYNEKVVNNNIQSPQIMGNYAGGVKLAPDSVVYVTSGLFDPGKSTVLSYCHKAIRPMNQLRFIEDAVVVYTISRAPERRVFYVSVGNMPRLKAEQFLKDMMLRYRNKLQYDACLAMDTKIPLLDGRTLTLAELEVEFLKGERLWVYSCDPVTGKFAPGIVSFAGVTKRDQQVMRLTLDNGETITCTPDHKFPLWVKGKTEAKDIQVGDSMIPFYRRETGIVSSKSSTYEQIYENHEDKWRYTHRLVSQWKDDNGVLNEWEFDAKFAGMNKKTVHHKNYHRHDNTPENLVRMYRDDHFAYHKQHNGLAGKISSQKKRDQGLPFFKYTPEEHREVAAKAINAKIKRMAEDPAYKEHIQSVAIGNYAKARQVKAEKLLNDDKFREESHQKSSANMAKAYTVLRERLKVEPELKESYRIRAARANQIRWEKHRQQKALHHNHKIVKVEMLDERMDTGTLSIDNEELYHNHHTFALAAGIYTFNSTGEIQDSRRYQSMIEDFWMPRSNSGKDTEVTTLPSGTGLINNDLIQYFKNALYRSLSVPISRMESQQGFSLGRTNEITRDEIKFDKFIKKLQDRFAILFDEVMARQLTLKGICTLEEWAQFKQDIHYKFQRDNMFEEIKESEMWNNRFQQLGIVEPYVGIYISRRWAKENILHFDEKQIADLTEEMENEAKEMEKLAKKQQMSQQGQPGLATAGGEALNTNQNAQQINQAVSDQFSGSSAQSSGGAG